MIVPNTAAPIVCPVPDPAVIRDLLRRYRNAAMTHRAASRSGDSRTANEAAEALAAIIRTLRDEGEAAHRSILELLDDADLAVRGWAGTHGLEIDPPRAEAALEEISGGPKSLDEFSARMVLHEWRAGRLSFP